MQKWAVKVLSMVGAMALSHNQAVAEIIDFSAVEVVNNSVFYLDSDDEDGDTDVIFYAPNLFLNDFSTTSELSTIDAPAASTYGGLDPDIRADFLHGATGSISFDFGSNDIFQDIENNPFLVSAVTVQAFDNTDSLIASGSATAEGQRDTIFDPFDPVLSLCDPANPIDCDPDLFFFPGFPAQSSFSLDLAGAVASYATIDFSSPGFNGLEDTLHLLDNFEYSPSSSSVINDFEGSLSNDPFLGTTLVGPDGNTVFEFEFDVTPNGLGQRFPFFFDPDIAVGYDYESTTGNPFASVLIPETLPNGDMNFTLVLPDGSTAPIVVGNTIDLLDFNTNGFTEFSIIDISTDEALDPEDMLAFVTGVTFLNAGAVSVTQTPIVEFVGATPVPVPAAIGLLLTGLLMLRGRTSRPGLKDLRRKLAVVGSCLLICLPASAFDAVFELSSLDGSNGFVLRGVAPGERSGTSVSNLGDINEDGLADIIIGAPTAEIEGNTSAGKGYVVFGGSGVGSTGLFDLNDLDGSNGFVLNGNESFYETGFSVSDAGDVNGDGIRDILLGARLADPDGRGDAGETYVIFGGAGIGAGGSIALGSLNGSDGYVLKGEAIGDISGDSVSKAGDVNGDGITDFIVGARFARSNSGSDQRSREGAAYIVFGGPNVGAGGEFELGHLDGSNGFKLTGTNDLDEFGVAVSGAGDVNGDGVDDLLVGARLADSDGNSNAGRAYVVFGDSSLGGNGTVTVSDLDGTNGFSIEGENAFDGLGSALSSAGDINNDGIVDLLIGAESADPNGAGESGEVYVIFGGKGLGTGGLFDLGSLDGNNGFALQGVDAGDRFGTSVSGVGDVNGDQIDDFLIGASSAGGNGVQGGESYLFFGSNQIGDNGVVSADILDGANGVRFDGVNSGYLSGRAVSAAGDLNDDGLNDLLIGAPGARLNNLPAAGETYIVFGQRSAVGVSLPSSVFMVLVGTCLMRRRIV